MSDKLTLYFSRGSIASQACLMLIKILNIEIDLENVDSNDEDLLEIVNPVHKVPVLVHDELVLSESRAIMSYLVGFFKSGDSFYPIDLKKRAIIDQRLFYDAAVIYPSVINLIVSLKIIFNFKKYDNFFSGQ